MRRARAGPSAARIRRERKKSRLSSTRHPGENRGPAMREASRVGKSLLTMDMANWIPAFAGMTLVFLPRGEVFCLAGRTDKTMTG